MSKKEMHVHVLNKVPAGVKVIAVFEYVLAGLLTLLGLTSAALSFVWDKVLSGMAEQGQDISALSQLSSAYLLKFGLVCIALAVLFIVIAIKIWRLRNWSRLVHIIVYGAFIIQSVWLAINGFVTILGIFQFAISVMIVWYLAFSEAKNAFK